MALDDKVSVMLEVKEGTVRETVKNAVEKLGYLLDENYNVPMSGSKTVIYLISGPKNNYEKVDESLRKNNWVHGLWSNPKLDYFEGDDIVNEWGEQK